MTTIGKTIDDVLEQRHRGKRTPQAILDCLEELRLFFTGYTGQRIVDDEDYATLLRAAIVCAEAG